MDNINKSNPTDKDLIIGKIQLLAGKTKVYGDPDELETYKKLIKKNVPWHLRGYLMAYLLKEVMNPEKPARVQKPRPQRKPRIKNMEPFEKKNPVVAQSTDTEGEKTENKVQTPKPKKERIYPDGSRTLYLNIGKMKKLYAKELSIMLQEDLSIKREDVYAVRVHDKYSFITMSQENCEKAIEVYSGKEIKGRTASITYSNKE
ncbi:MAG: DbpA RNA binding domain-containing protein [Spirochaetaceae bacterium]|nr:DbpA RNA binding domain-containing protein [Spirochaetaceae bacterium]